MDIVEAIKKEGFRRRLSNKTISSYCFYVRKFLKFCNKEPRKVTKKDIKDYIYYLSERNLAGSTLNVALNSVKFVTEEILFKRWKLDIKFSKTPKGLPTVLTKNETIRLINSIDNKKHKLMISLMYSAGLRLSELIHLKVKDIENIGWVRKGKGDKDRAFIIAEKLKEEIKNWIRKNNLEYDSYIFKGNKNAYISKATVQVIVKKAARLAGIKKNVHPHTLRHSFATHLIEDGYDVASVQSLLGHNSAQTTMTYVHMACPKMINVKSPFDRLQLKLKLTKAI